MEPPARHRLRRNRATRLLRQAGLACLCTAAIGCIDGGTGPRDDLTTLAIQPLYPTSVDFRAFNNLVVDRVHFRLVRPPLEILVDTVLPFPADSNRIALRATVKLLSQVERLEATLDLFQGPELLFHGTETLQVTEGINVFPVAAIPVEYVGPGRDITSLVITPRDTVISLGDTFGFDVIASRNGIVVEPPVYLSWASSNPNLAPVSLFGNVAAPNQRGAIQLLVTTPSGARDSTRVSFSPPGVLVHVLNGTGQSAQVGGPLPEPFLVQVLAADAIGVPGVRVQFFPPSGAFVENPVAITDAGGVARTNGTLGPTVGKQTFRAEVPGLPTVSHTIDALPGPAQAIEAFGGDGQTGVVGTALANPLAVRVTDRFGNAIANVRVEWQVLSGGGSVTPIASVTDVLGFATTVFTLGPVPGQQDALASVPGTDLLRVFSAAAISPPPP